jgi:hypothetical protein
VIRQTKQKQTKLPKGTLLSAIKEETYTPLRYALCCAWQFSFSTHAALFCLNAIPASSIRYNLVIGGVLFVDSFRFFDVTVRGERIAWLESRLRREFFIIIFSKREREVAVGCRLERARPMSVYSTRVLYRNSIEAADYVQGAVCSMSERIRCPLGIRCIGVSVRL